MRDLPLKAGTKETTEASRKKVLFISHDAKRTGAPIILLDLLRWLKGNTDIPFQVLLKRTGALEAEFRNLGRVDLFKGNGGGPLHFIPGFGEWSRKGREERLRRELARTGIGLVYSNTITNGEVLRFLSTLGCPVITHVHELEYWIERLGPANMDYVRSYTDHYIVVSEAVKRNLMVNHLIPEEKIDIVKGFIPLAGSGAGSGATGGIRPSLGIPGHAFVVGGSGAEIWRKGKDLFIQTALSVARKHPNREIHFLWVGGDAQGSEMYELEHDIRHSGVAGTVHLVEHVPNPADYYREFDVFAMTSREDPFPLVNLEVAAMGKPVVCFDDSGGTPEFIGDDAGFVVPYLDVEAMADRIILLATHEKLRRSCGEAAAEKVRVHHDISVGAVKIARIIKRFLPDG